ncbi:11099_t:CDS:1 [Acaulospora morrowiae]|uniref:11099_t:CDS:1 n=1 Tax=Acaulospora morrowiae TaxID=94023 RepID=A0A9N9C4I4_9GLOM|nr:11099_t:CDS:1 [Acaulospora morrowiae]
MAQLERIIRQHHENKKIEILGSIEKVIHLEDNENYAFIINEYCKSLGSFSLGFYVPYGLRLIGYDPQKDKVNIIKKFPDNSPSTGYRSLEDAVQEAENFIEVIGMTKKLDLLGLQADRDIDIISFKQELNSKVKDVNLLVNENKRLVVELVESKQKIIDLEKKLVEYEAKLAASSYQSNEQS